MFDCFTLMSKLVTVTLRRNAKISSKYPGFPCFMMHSSLKLLPHTAKSCLSLSECLSTMFILQPFHFPGRKCLPLGRDPRTLGTSSRPWKGRKEGRALLHYVFRNVPQQQLQFETLEAQSRQSYLPQGNYQN